MPEALFVHDAATTVRAGGVAPPGHLEDASAVSARAYAHPAIAGRVVVRVVADAVGAGADAEMEALGFGEPTVRAAVGQQRFRALGFPGWALVHDPKRARFALEVTRDFKKAKKRVTFKPGFAKEAFDEMAKKLGRTVPHFLPSFWEEAGRAFLEESSVSFAAQAFEKARQAEKEHGLKVDEDARAATFLEFALAGALSVKSLSAYAKDLEKSVGAKDAYVRFRAIALQRTMGGMAPWSSMARDLRALAKSAKLDLAAEDDAVIAELVDAPSIGRAPAEFWSSYRDAIVRVGKRDAVARSRLLHLFPSTEAKDDFADAFLALLEDTGALAALASDEGPPLAEWVSKLSSFAGASARAQDLLRKLAPRLVAEGKPIAVAVKRRWSSELSLDLAELALSLGVALADPAADPDEEASFNLEGVTCDPVHVMAHPRYGALLVAAVGDAMTDDDLLEATAGKAGFTNARAAWVDARIDAVERGTLATADLALAELESQTTPATFAELPESLLRLSKITLDAALARTLRGGVIDEFGWPAYEDAFARLKGEAHDVHLEGAFPHLVVRDTRRAIVIGASGVVLDHELALSSKQEVTLTLFVDGQLLVLFRDRKSRDEGAYWSASPSSKFEPEASLRFYDADVPVATEVPGHGVTMGRGALRAGDTKLAGFEHYLTDGNAFFREDGDALVAFDPRTDAAGRASKPRFLEDFVAEGAKLSLSACSLHRAPPGLGASPLGMKDGLVGMRARIAKGVIACESIDGMRWSAAIEGHFGHAQSEPYALVRFPGAKEPCAVVRDSRYSDRFDGGCGPGADLYAGDGLLLARLNEDGARGYARGWGEAHVPPVEAWHFLSPRDERGSAALRAVSAEGIAKVLAVARGELSAEYSDEGEMPSLPRTTEALASAVPAITNPRLAKGVVGLVAHAAWLAVRVAGFADRAPRVADADGPGGTLLRFDEALARGEAKGLGSFTFDLAPLLREARSMVLLALSGLPKEKDEDEEGDGRDPGPLVRALAKTRIADGSTSLRVLAVRPEEEDAWEDSEHEQAEVFTHEKNVFFLDKAESLLIERSSDESFHVPAGMVVTDETRFTYAPGSAWLEAALALVDAGERVAWDPAIAEALAQRTGLSRAEAALLWLGAPDVSRWEKDFLGKARREVLGLKVIEAEAARTTFRKIEGDVRAMIGEAAPADPRAWLTPLAPDASGESPVESLARAWCKRFGKRAELPEALVVLVKKDLDLALPPASLLSVFVDPDASLLLKAKATPLHEVDSRTPTAEGFTTHAAEGLALLFAYVAFMLPVGDPVRAGIPRLLERVRERLNDPEVLLPLPRQYSERDDNADIKARLEALGGAPVALPAIDDEACDGARDTGTIVAGLYGSSLFLAFRPSALRDVARDKVLLGFAQDDDDSEASLDAAVALLSPGFTAIAARVTKTPVPEGGFEANPCLSCPALVLRVKDALDVAEDSAALYLQVLTLAEPTSKAILRFNAWKPARYVKAEDELVAKKLLVRAKRERAGRDTFLPGEWRKGSNQETPMEAYKHAFYNPVVGKLAKPLPLEPLHALYARAWARYEGGDTPGFEAVR